MNTNNTSISITPRDTRSMQLHLGEISNRKYDVLPIEQEIELANRSRKGDIQARNTLVEHNMRLAITIAKSYQNQGVELEDLIVAAEVGLIAAAEQFDPTVGVKFISYACHHIRREITNMLTNEARTIRLPQNIVTKQRLLKRAIMRYQLENNYTPSDDELAQMLHITPNEVQSLRHYLPGSISMDSPLGDNSNETIGSVLIGDNASTDAKLLQESIRQQLNIALDSLDSRDALILNRSFGLNGNKEETIDHIAEDLGLSRERVRQIRDQALRKLRTTHGDNLRTYRA